MVWKNIAKSNLAMRSYGSDTDFGECVHCYLDLGDITVGQGYGTSFGDRQ